MDFPMGNTFDYIMGSHLPGREPTFFNLPELSTSTSTLNGEGWEEKENFIEDEDYVAPRPVLPTPQTPNPGSFWPNPRSIRRTKRLSKSQLKASQDFTIVEDDTAWDAGRPHRSYFGSNVPVFGEVPNVEQFQYTTYHTQQRRFRDRLPFSRYIGDERMVEFINNELDRDYVSLAEQVTGYYHWTIEERPSDVWMWVEMNNYHRRWTRRQREGFQTFINELKRIGVDAVRLRNEGQETAANCLGDVASVFLQNLTVSLKITNLVVIMLDPSTYRFYPFGEDMPRLNRADFNRDEQEFIDVNFPSLWADFRPEHLRDVWIIDRVSESQQDVVGESMDIDGNTEEPMDIDGTIDGTIREFMELDERINDAMSIDSMSINEDMNSGDNMSIDEDMNNEDNMIIDESTENNMDQDMDMEDISGVLMGLLGDEIMRDY